MKAIELTEMTARMTSLLKMAQQVVDKSKYYWLDHGSDLKIPKRKLK